MKDSNECIFLPDFSALSLDGLMIIWSKRLLYVKKNDD